MPAWSEYFLNGKTAGELLLKACDESKTVNAGRLDTALRLGVRRRPHRRFQSAIGSKLDIVEVVIPAVQETRRV